MCAWSWNFCPILPFVIWLQIHFHSCLTLQWSPSQPISILRSTDGTQIIQVTKKKFPRFFFHSPWRVFPVVTSEFDSHLAIPPSPTVPASSGSTATSGTEAAKVKGRAKCNAKTGTSGSSQCLKNHEKCLIFFLPLWTKLFLNFCT